MYVRQAPESSSLPSMLYRSLLRPLLFRLPPETAHEAALHWLGFVLKHDPLRQFIARRYRRTSFGELRCFGLSFANPVGLAAGFDKNGTSAQALAALGFGFIEVGTVTHMAQPGNPRPRLFRLPDDRALINRAGFNNDGAAALAKRLMTHRPDCVLGINIGKSRTVAIEDAVADYLATFDLVYPLADYIAINVSSPNTPHLRELQQADRLTGLLSQLQQRNRELAARMGRALVPLLVKIAPDLSISDLEIIVDAVRRTEISGIIATNTTTNRAQLRHTSPAVVKACGQGGLSGVPLRARSTEVIAVLYRLTDGKIPIIGVGGIFTAADAWEKIMAGASLVQLYTGFVYQGVKIVRDINDGLLRTLDQYGFRSLTEAVGCRAKELAVA